jgi:hypothetical protein
MIAFIVRIGCGFLLVIVLFGAASCAFLARLNVPADVPIVGNIAPDAPLVVVADVAPVYTRPNDTAQIVGSFSVGMQVRSMGPETDEWVAVHSSVPMLTGWVRRADIAELRR